MYKHNFKKQFGQNFLKSPTHIKKLVDGAEITPEDIIVEVGPGNGAATRHLLEQAKQVIALEIDSELIEPLQDEFTEFSNFEVINIDALEFKPEEYFGQGEEYKFVSSLPYNISKPLIKKFLTNQHPPKLMSVILQKEVAQDYVAQAPKSTFLSDFAHIYAEVKYLGKIPARYFHPKPKVDGGILQFRLKDDINPEEAEKLCKFIRAGFTHPRKTLVHNLSIAGYDKEEIRQKLIAMGLSEQVRAAELEINVYEKLVTKYVP